MKKIVQYSLLGLIFSPMMSHALGIDSMLEFAERDKAKFTLTSTENYRQFLQVGITQLDVKDGKLIKTPYTRENIQDWNLLVRPARTVLEPHLSKLFQVEFKPTNKKRPLDTDQAFQLSFIPTPYFAEGEPVTHSVKVAMGFAPIVIVPAKKDKPIQYEVQYGDDNTLTLTNHGGTYFRALLDACPKGTVGDAREACSRIVYALSGRTLPVSLSDAMKTTEGIKVELSTHNVDYEEKFTLMTGQAKTNWVEK